MTIWNPAAIPPKKSSGARTFKYALAVFLLTAGLMLSGFLVWWTVTVTTEGFHRGITGSTLRAFAWQFLWFAVPALACAFGGAALLQAARGTAPTRRRFDRFTVKNILLVAYPSGCELLEFIEREPEAASEIIDGVFFERRERTIYVRAMGLVKQPNDDTDGKVYAAIAQARELYK